MIPMMNIIAWSQTAPWAETRQVEQDLIISRALVEIFSDPILRKQLRFRGGTALNKLHFPTPLRYSEDIDLVRTRTHWSGARPCSRHSGAMAGQGKLRAKPCSAKAAIQSGGGGFGSNGTNQA